MNRNRWQSKNWLTPALLAGLLGAGCGAAPEDTDTAEQEFGRAGPGHHGAPHGRGNPHHRHHKRPPKGPSPVRLTSITLDPEDANGAITFAPGAWETNPADSLSKLLVTRNGVVQNQPIDANCSLGAISTALNFGVNTFDIDGNLFFPQNSPYGAVLFFDNAVVPQIAVFNGNGSNGPFSVQAAGTPIQGVANGGEVVVPAPGTDTYVAPDGTTVRVLSFTIDSTAPGRPDLVSFCNTTPDGNPDTTAVLRFLVTPP